MAPAWGLVGRCSSHFEIQLVTLQSVDIEVSIRGFVSQVNASLTYHNTSDKPLEVEYRMPIDEGAAVYRFEAIVNDRKITAQCMERKKAEGVYKEAVQSGHTAVLAREDSLTADIFHLALGNLPAGSKAELQIGMVMELKVKTDGAVNFTLPVVLNPRYCPADVSNSMHTTSVAWYDTPEIAVALAVYTFNIKCSVQGGHSISRIISHSDALNVTLSDDAMSAKVTQDGGFKPDHDWTMLLYYSNAYKTHIIRETGDRSSTRLMKDDLIMVNLHPEISEQSYSCKNEVIFVVDCSGSMEGMSMVSARATLLLFLKSLPAGCYFNVIKFGNTHSSLFPKGSEKYTEQTLFEACILHEKMAADMGGTEILQPLKHIYSTVPKPGYARQILLLSDGQIFNVDQVKQLVSRHAHEARVFAVGLGDGASTALINGLARAGRGRSEMVYQRDKLQLKVMGLLKSMLQESVQEVKVNFEVDPPGGIKLIPKVPPVIFGGQHLILYARVPPSTSVRVITIKGVIGDEVYSTAVQGSDIIAVHDEQMTLHRLAARAQINQWQVDDEEDVAEETIALSLSSGVVSRLTALVGVDQDMTPVIAAPPKPQSLPQSTASGFSFSGVPQLQQQQTGSSLFSSSGFSFGGGVPQQLSQISSRNAAFGPAYGMVPQGGMVPQSGSYSSNFSHPPTGGSSLSRSSGLHYGGVPQPQYSPSSGSVFGAAPLPPPPPPAGHSFSFGVGAPARVDSYKPMCGSSLFGSFGGTGALPPPPPVGAAPPTNLNFGFGTSAMRRFPKFYDDDDDDDDEGDVELPVQIIKEQKSTLMDIVNLQKFDGSWTPEDAARLTSLPQQRLRDTNAAKTELSWATALVLAYLEMEHSSEQDQWVLLANKARMFITSGGDDVKALISTATNILSNK